jgi:hypothetical protein
VDGRRARRRAPVLSHGSAAALWQLRAASTAWIDVTVPRTGRRPRDRVRVHRPRTLSEEEVSTRHGIPVTTPARTVLDLAATLKRDHLNRVLDEIEIREPADHPVLDALARAHAGHRGRRGSYERSAPTRPAATAPTAAWSVCS